MLAFPAAIRIYVAVQPVDMRKSFNGLWTAASERLHEDPKNSPNLPPLPVGYMDKAVEVAGQRVMLGGHRLADTLTATLPK